MLRRPTPACATRHSLSPPGDALGARELPAQLRSSAPPPDKLISCSCCCSQIFCLLSIPDSQLGHLHQLGHMCDQPDSQVELCVLAAFMVRKLFFLFLCCHAAQCAQSGSKSQRPCLCSAFIFVSAPDILTLWLGSALDVSMLWPSRSAVLKLLLALQPSNRHNHADYHYSHLGELEHSSQL